MKILFLTLLSLVLLYFIYNVGLFCKTKVPFVKTPKKTLPHIFANIKITSETVIYDLGCGTGTFLLAAEKYQPKELIGFELSPVHSLIAKIKIWLKKSKVKIIYRNFLKVNLAPADIIYLFLTIPTKTLAQKISTEAKKNCLVISLGAAVPNFPITKKITTEQNKINIYFHQL